MKASRLRWLMNIWFPFLFTGIRVKEISDDFRYVKVELRSHWYNRNYVGTHFGGSLFAMTDPFWMIMILRNIGSDYVVWDKAADIEFIKPGRGLLTTEFRLEEAMLEELRQAAAGNEKVLRWFDILVSDSQGDLVAKVRKQVYVRRKAPKNLINTSPKP
jgi:acyl-coenzyme A thioesterase PaaI-like protein